MVRTRSQTLNRAVNKPTQTTSCPSKKRQLKAPSDTSTRVHKRGRQPRERSPLTTVPGNSVLRWLRQREHSNMNRILAERKSSASASSRSQSRGRKRSEPGDSDTGSATVPYSDLKFNKLLERHGSYFNRSPAGLTQQSKDLCRELQAGQPPLPPTDFFGDKFESICNQTRNRNEARIIQTITPNIVPSAEVYSMHCNSDNLVENWNESWTNARLLSQIEKRPQPDYAVGFRHDAFTEEEREKLKPGVGDVFANDQSPFMATYMMCFPFLTCEVKCGSAALDAADRQNGLSMTIAIRGVVKLFREVGRQKELHGEILGFSVSHDASSVRIYAHYVEIAEDNTTCFREAIRTFYFTEQEGKERGTSYRIITNIYKIWVPMHLNRIRSAISQLLGPSTLGQSKDEDGHSPLSPATTQTSVTTQETSKRSRINDYDQG